MIRRKMSRFWCLPIYLVVFTALIFSQQRYSVSGQLQYKNTDALTPTNPDDFSANKTFLQHQHSANEEDENENRPVSLVRQLRKQLRSKQRRLRKLTNEIQNLKAKLKPDGVVISSNVTTTTTMTTKRINKLTSKTSWRRRVMNELKRLNEQIRILSTYKLHATTNNQQNQTDTSGDGGQRNNRRRSRKKGKIDRNRLKNNNGETSKPFDDGVTGSPSVRRQQTTEDQTKIRLQIRRMRNKRKRLKKIKSMWENGGYNKTRNIPLNVAKGEPGYQCKAHKECRPGSCCHKITPNNSTSVCFEHRLDAGTQCANSCQCVHGLNCFRTRKDKLHHKKLSPPFDFSSASNFDDDQQRDRGRCKVATTDDVLHGEYVNSDNSTFSSLDLF